MLGKVGFWSGPSLPFFAASLARCLALFLTISSILSMKHCHVSKMTKTLTLLKITASLLHTLNVPLVNLVTTELFQISLNLNDQRDIKDDSNEHEQDRDDP